MTVVVLGGTAEARSLAAALHGRGARVVTSLAGAVRDVAVPAGEVRVGGAVGVAGLVRLLESERATCVVDATHPFAASISATAVDACAATSLPLLRLTRPPWTPQPGDTWHEVDSLGAAAEVLPSLGTHAFLTTGRQTLSAFAALEGMRFLIRCVDPPEGPLPPQHEVILARGPHDAVADLELMRRHGVDVVVTKNSGGEATSGKLLAARDLGVPVVMVRRPQLPPAPTRTTVASAVDWVAEAVA